MTIGQSSTSGSPPPSAASSSASPVTTKPKKKKKKKTTSEKLWDWIRGVNKFAAVLIVATVTGYASVVIYNKYDYWHVGVAILNVGIACTLIPLAFSFLNFGKLNPPGDWFDEADYLGAYKQVVESHYTRVKGTLTFWKNKAAAYHRLHNARVLWSLISAVSLPVLIQKYDVTNPWSSFFLTELTTWTGLLVALAYTFKAEEKYQGLRQQESDFYDLSRQYLDDAAAAAAANDSAQIVRLSKDYVDQVRQVRRVARRVETGSPPSAL